MKYPQRNKDGVKIILDGIYGKKKNDPRVQAIIKRSRHNSFCDLIISQGYYETPKRTIPANGSFYLLLKAKNFRYFQNLFHAIIDTTLKDIIILVSTCWKKKHQPLAKDTTKEKNTRHHDLGFNSLFVSNTNLL